MTAEELKLYHDREQVLAMIVSLSFELSAPILTRVGVVPGVTPSDAIDLRTEVRELIENRLREYASAYLFEYGKQKENP